MAHTFLLERAELLFEQPRLDVRRDQAGHHFEESQFVDGEWLRCALVHLQDADPPRSAEQRDARIRPQALAVDHLAADAGTRSQVRHRDRLAEREHLPSQTLVDPPRLQCLGEALGQAEGAVHVDLLAHQIGEGDGCGIRPHRPSDLGHDEGKGGSDVVAGPQLMCDLVEHPEELHGALVGRASGRLRRGAQRIDALRGGIGQPHRV